MPNSGPTFGPTSGPTPGPTFVANSRLPDPRIRVLDEQFLALRLLSGTVEQLATGFYWAEGPQWFGDGRYLLFSDIPNNRILRWDETTGGISDFRKPSNHANGLARDRQGRLLACEHGTRRVTRTEYDGRISVLASHYKGKRLNSPQRHRVQERRQHLVHRPAVWHLRLVGRRTGDARAATRRVPHRAQQW